MSQKINTIIDFFRYKGHYIMISNTEKEIKGLSAEADQKMPAKVCIFFARRLRNVSHINIKFLLYNPSEEPSKCVTKDGSVLRSPTKSI